MSPSDARSAHLGSSRLNSGLRAETAAQQSCHAPRVRDVPYTEVAPPAELAAYVDRFWFRSSARDGGLPHRILPDGCVDLMIDARLGAGFVVGTMSRALVVPSRAAVVVAARLLPGRASAVLGRPLAEFTDLRVSADDAGLSGALIPALDAITRDGSLDTAAGARRVIAALARALTARLRGGSDRRCDRSVLGALDVLRREHRPIDALARDLGVSRQHLTRHFKSDVGVGPKAFARIARMQRVVTAIERGRHDFARLALDHGYVDQSHLAHEVSALVGLSPSGLFALHRAPVDDPPRPLPHLFPPAFPDGSISTSRLPSARARSPR